MRRQQREVGVDQRHNVGGGLYSDSCFRVLDEVGVVLPHVLERLADPVDVDGCVGGVHPPQSSALADYGCKRP